VESAESVAFFSAQFTLKAAASYRLSLLIARVRFNCALTNLTEMVYFPVENTQKWSSVLGIASGREEGMSGTKLKFLLGGIVIVGALAWLGFVGFQESKAYYITVGEFSAMQGDVQGKSLKVAGDVVEGSIDRSKNPLEFVISSEGKNLRVRYIGRDVIPDTFKDGSKAVVEGMIGQDGVFQARQIEAKCASKYEAEYEKKAKR
jgi:cytochrome c-type biogenesis protein CcmE